MARYRCCTCYSRTWSAGSLAVIRSRRKEIAGGLVNPVQPFHPNVPPPNDVVLLIRRHGFNNAMIWFVKLITDPFTDIVAYLWWRTAQKSLAGKRRRRQDDTVDCLGEPG